MRFTESRQEGMTLVQVASVLFLFALLTGATLKAHGLVEHQQAKTLAREMREVKDVLYAYRTKFKNIPGDDPIASSHMSGAINSTWYPGDNRIDWCCTHWVGSPTVQASSFEPALFWNHVRLAGLALGDPLRGEAFNSVGGHLGVSSVTSGAPRRPARTGGLYMVCSGKIPGRLARMMDVEMDDGDATTGTVWAGAETQGREVEVDVAPTPYDDAATYTVCMAF